MRPEQFLRFEACAEQLEPRVQLAAFVVDTLDGGIDGDVSAGQFSLAEAVEQANATPEHDTITCAQGLSGTIQLNDSIAVRSSMDIRGPSDRSIVLTGPRGLLIADEDPEGPNVAPDPSRAIQVLISSLAFENAGPIGVDAYLAHNSELTLSEVRIAEHAIGLRALGSPASTVTVEQSIVTRNTRGNGFGNLGEGGQGGGIYNAVTMIVRDTEITSNEASERGGAGVLNSSSGTLTLELSLVAFNVGREDTNTPAGGGGAGIINAGEMVVRNSTISGNSSIQLNLDVFPDGIANSGILSVYNSTIAENEGGGISNDGTLVLVSSIVAKNDYPSAYYVSLQVSNSGQIDSSSSHNWIGVNNSGLDGTVLTNAQNSNFVGVAGELGPLGMNGGPTRTHSLPAGHFAIDAGLAGSNATDQRGQPRVIGAAADIGAYEFGAEVGFSLLAEGDAKVVTVSNAMGVHFTAVRNSDGMIIVFEETGSGWSVSSLQRFGGELAISDVAIWADPMTDRIQVAAVSANGILMVFERLAAGQWEYAEIADLGPITTVVGFSQVRTVGAAPDQVIHLAVQTILEDATSPDDSNSQFVIYRLLSANEAANDNRARSWVNAFSASQQEVPVLSGLIGYATPWNSVHFNGVDTEANSVMAVWKPVGPTGWFVNTLSNNTASTLGGAVSVVLTPWNGINISTVSADTSELWVTWWVPSFGGNWENTNLTWSIQSYEHRLQVSTISGYGTQWGGINFVGTNLDGEMSVYWWAPASGGWRADRLIDEVVNANESSTLVTGLGSHSSSFGPLSIVGVDADGHIGRYNFTPQRGKWAFDDLTAVAELA